MESNRQKKIAGIIQKDLANTLQEILRESGTTGVIISVTKVNVTPDLGYAKAYLSIFPPDKADPILKEVIALRDSIRYKLAQLTKNQLRRMPELSFYRDDSLDYIDQIDRELKQGIDPVKNPESLDPRKKI